MNHLQIHFAVDPDRWSNVDEGNTQAPVEMLTLEDAQIQDHLASGTDVETTQDLGAP